MVNNFVCLAANRVAVLVVVTVQLVHRIAEQTAVLVLSLVLGHQLGLLLARSRENRTHSRRHLSKTRLCRNLRRTRLFRGRVTQLAGRHFAGLLVRAEVHIAVLAHFLFHALNKSHGLNFCHVVRAILVSASKLHFEGSYSDALTLRSAKTSFYVPRFESASKPAERGK